MLVGAPLICPTSYSAYVPFLAQGISSLPFLLTYQGEVSRQVRIFHSHNVPVLLIPQICRGHDEQRMWRYFRIIAKSYILEERTYIVHFGQHIVRLM